MTLFSIKFPFLYKIISFKFYWIFTQNSILLLKKISFIPESISFLNS
ncbi:hypothetical protein STRDD11_02157 [Streptococcus sp. DD11]|nr:hypothetical protein STRDD11_02157 [Streptococcus sp. DD11]